MNPKAPMISVIIPVYNVESYLEKCLESVLAQTYPNIELILVDDASTDLSGRICDAYTARDERIQTVHFPVNRGISAVRNEGVRRAGGNYITFIDSDDYVEPRLLEKLYDNLIGSGADISICRAEGLVQKAEPARTYSAAETICCMARRAPFLWNVWGKLFLTDIVKKYPFNEGIRCNEDLLFFYQMLKDAETIHYFPDTLYHYLYRPGSLINSGVDEKRCTVLSVLDHICADASVHFPEAVPGLKLLAMDTVVRLAMQAVEGGTKGADLSAYLKRFRENIRHHFSWRALALCRDKKTKFSILVLYASRTAFHGIAAVYKYIKKGSGKTPGME